MNVPYNRRWREEKRRVIRNGVTRRSLNEQARDRSARTYYAGGPKVDSSIELPETLEFYYFIWRSLCEVQIKFLAFSCAFVLVECIN